VACWARWGERGCSASVWARMPVMVPSRCVHMSGGMWGKGTQGGVAHRDGQVCKWACHIAVTPLYRLHRAGCTPPIVSASCHVGSACRGCVGHAACCVAPCHISRGMGEGRCRQVPHCAANMLGIHSPLPATATQVPSALPGRGTCGCGHVGTCGHRCMWAGACWHVHIWCRRVSCACACVHVWTWAYVGEHGQVGSLQTQE